MHNLKESTFLKLHNLRKVLINYINFKSYQLDTKKILMCYLFLAIRTQSDFGPYFSFNFLRVMRNNTVTESSKGNATPTNYSRNASVIPISITLTQSCR